MRLVFLTSRNGAAEPQAKIVIWIARKFMEEHRQATDFLNQTDSGDLRLYAVLGEASPQRRFVAGAILALAPQVWKILFAKLELRSCSTARILCLAVAQLHAANLSGDSLWQIRKFDASNAIEGREGFPDVLEN